MEYPFGMMSAIYIFVCFLKTGRFICLLLVLLSFILYLCRICSIGILSMAYLFFQSIISFDLGHLLFPCFKKLELLCACFNSDRNGNISQQSKN